MGISVLFIPTTYAIVFHPDEKKEEIMDDLFLQGMNEAYVWQVHIP